MKLSEKELRVIEQVLIVNGDICALFEKRGVSRDDVKEVFRLAEIGRQAEEFKKGEGHGT